MFIAEVTDLTEVYSQSLPVSETWLCFVHCKFFFLFYVFITNSSRMLSFFTHCPRTFLHYPELILCFMHPVYSFLGLFYFLIEYILQKFSKKKGSEKVPVILFILTLSGLTGYRILWWNWFFFRILDALSFSFQECCQEVWKHYFWSFVLYIFLSMKVLFFHLIPNVLKCHIICPGGGCFSVHCGRQAEMVPVNGEIFCYFFTSSHTLPHFFLYDSSIIILYLLDFL